MDEFHGLFSYIHILTPISISYTFLNQYSVSVIHHFFFPILAPLRELFFRRSMSFSRLNIRISKYANPFLGLQTIRTSILLKVSEYFFLHSE